MGWKPKLAGNEGALVEDEQRKSLDERLEELEEKHQKKLEEIHQKKVDERIRKQLEEVERKRAEELKKKREQKKGLKLIQEALLSQVDEKKDKEETAQKKKTRPLLIAVVAAIIVLILANYFFSRGWDLTESLDRIKPGMTHGEVVKLVPGTLVKKEKAQVDRDHGVTVFTYLVEPDVEVKTYMHLGYTGIMPSGDYAHIFFDENDRVVGIECSLESGGWSPSWGENKWMNMAK